MVSKGTPKDCYMDDQSNTSFYSFWQSTFLGEYSQQSTTFKTFHQQFFFIKRKNRQDSQAGTFVRCLAIFLQLYELIYVRGYVLYYRWFLLPFVCFSYIRNTLWYAEGVLTKLHRSKANFLVQKSWEIELCFGMFCKSSFETPMHVSTKLFPWFFFAVGTVFFYYTFKSPLSKTVGMHDMKQSFSPTAILLYSTRFFMDPWYKKSCFNLHNLCKVEANKRKYAKHVENFSIFICNLSQLWG